MAPAAARELRAACRRSAAADALLHARRGGAAAPPSPSLLVPWASGDAWRVIVSRPPRAGADAHVDDAAAARRRARAAGCSCSGSEDSDSESDSDGGSVRTCDSTEISCRFCFCGEDAEPEGELVSPCACLGTQRFVHLRCLRAWQRVSQLNGSAEKALKCDVCQAPFRCRPPALPLRQQAGVALRSAAFFAGRAWILGTAAACVLGAAGGALASGDLLGRAALRALLWLDRRAASSAAFTTLASLALPFALPAAVLSASAVVAFHVVFGGIFGLVLGVAGFPVLSVQSLLAAARGARRVAAAAAALASAAAGR